MLLNLNYACATCGHLLAMARTLDAPDPQSAAEAAKEPEGSPLCRKCSVQLREDGTPYGDTWTLEQMQIDGGRWLAIVGGRVHA